MNTWGSLAVPLPFLLETPGANVLTVAPGIYQSGPEIWSLVLFLKCLFSFLSINAYLAWGPGRVKTSMTIRDKRKSINPLTSTHSVLLCSHLGVEGEVCLRQTSPMFPRQPSTLKYFKSLRTFPSGNKPGNLQHQNRCLIKKMHAFKTQKEPLFCFVFGSKPITCIFLDYNTQSPHIWEEIGVRLIVRI